MDIFQVRRAVLLLEIPLVDIFDCTPRYVQVPGHVIDRHHSAQFCRITLEEPAAGSMLFRKAQLNLTQLLTFGAVYSWNIKSNVELMKTYRCNHDGPLDTATALDVPASAYRTVNKALLGTNPEDTLSIFIVSTFVGIANDILRVVQ
jgi:hypothetical protein